MTPRIDDEEAKTQLMDQWRALANVIDRLLFWITFLFLTAWALFMLIKIIQQLSPIRLD